MRGEEKGEAGGRRHPCRRPLGEDNTSYMTSESTRWMRKEPSKAEVERYLDRGGSVHSDKAHLSGGNILRTDRPQRNDVETRFP